MNNNNPDFSKEDLDTSHGAWQKYGNLDSQNRVTASNALLNRSLMPKTKREPLHVNPTGWHNKKINNHWLYNRSHLIGYQLTGQNNNWKNLMTGTRHLNDPDMQSRDPYWIFFALEMTPEQIYAKLISMYVFEKYGVQLTYKEIFSRGKDTKITDENYLVTKDNAIDKEVVIIKKGKKKYFLGLYK